MPETLKEFRVSTRDKAQFIDITSSVEKIIEETSVENGLCVVQILHTTAGITINENADPSVRGDIIAALGRMVPENNLYNHSEGNSPAHIKASLMGSSVFIAIENGSLLLGTWQGIYLCEFDGPRTRRVALKIIGN